jgi:hypothetical protein
MPSFEKHLREWVEHMSAGKVQWHRMEKTDGSLRDIVAECGTCSTVMAFGSAPYRFAHACGVDEYKPPVTMWQNLTTAELPRRKPLTVVAPAITFLKGCTGETEYTPDDFGMGGPAF